MPDRATPSPSLADDQSDRHEATSTARGALVAVGVAVLLLILFQGAALKRAAERQEPGWQRSVMMAVSAPVGWVSQTLPFSGLGDRFNHVISGKPIAADTADTAQRSADTGEISAAAFDPSRLGEHAMPAKPLRSLLVTGDSMAMPMDAQLARAFAKNDVRTTRDPHIGTGISKPEIANWEQLAKTQSQDTPDAVVMFLGANEGFPFTVNGNEVLCCGPDWAAIYATSVRRMMNHYVQNGNARVYWLLLPLPRSEERQPTARAVNDAVRVAAGDLRAYVRVIDLEHVFTPNNQYTDTKEINGRKTIVREADGIHLNNAGADVASRIVADEINKDFRHDER